MNVYYAPDHVGMETDGGAFSPYIFQGNENTCAIHSQYHVLKDYGYTGTVEDLKEMAIENGWYDPKHGTSIEDVGKLLEANGVPCDVYVNANEYNLVSELAQGKRVIVGVDSGELWEGEGVLTDFFERIFGCGADHAVVVSGINTADPNNVKVILTDSGAGQAAVEYPLDRFMDAWKDGKCTMWVPQNPPSPDQNLARLVNFDWELGHLAKVGEFTYDTIQSMQSVFERISFDNIESWWQNLKDEFVGSTTHPDGSTSFTDDPSEPGPLYSENEAMYDGEPETFDSLDDTMPDQTGFDNDWSDDTVSDNVPDDNNFFNGEV